MVISEFKAEINNNQHMIKAVDVIRILSFGIKDGAARMWAITDPIQGAPRANFRVLQAGDHLESEDVTLYVTTLHEKETKRDYFIFGEKPKIATTPMAPPKGGIQL